jgi:hypothetical protein
MGIFDIFKSKPSSDAILGQVQKAKEIYAQPEYRRMAMEKLLKWGTDESLKGLLERFCVVVQSPHWDEDEKSWLVDEFYKLGDRAKPILREFILKKNEVNYVLLAYRKIVANDEDYKALLKEALRERPPGDHRSVQGKQEIIAVVSEFDHDSFDDLVLPYLSDHSDDVQCAAIVALAESPRDYVKKSLVELLKSEVHSARVLRSAAFVVSKQKIYVPDNLELCDVVKDDFMIQSGHLIPINHPEST